MRWLLMAALLAGCAGGSGVYPDGCGDEMPVAACGTWRVNGHSARVTSGECTHLEGGELFLVAAGDGWRVSARAPLAGGSGRVQDLYADRPADFDYFLGPAEGCVADVLDPDGFGWEVVLTCNDGFDVALNAYWPVCTR